MELDIEFVKEVYFMFVFCVGAISFFGGFAFYSLIDLCFTFIKYISLKISDKKNAKEKEN